MTSPDMGHWTKAALLFLLLLVCGVGFFVTQKMREQLPPPAPHDLFAIVNQQLTALRSADFQSAYRHAASAVQQRFTLPQFERMVRERYPEMVRGYRVEYGVVKVQGSTAFVQVYLFASDDSVRSFLYSLTRETEGWKIDGVDELKGYREVSRLSGTHA